VIAARGLPSLGGRDELDARGPLEPKRELIEKTMDAASSDELIWGHGRDARLWKPDG